MVNIVASFAEAWIEIKYIDGDQITAQLSPPSRRRGLKSYHEEDAKGTFCRLLRGGVD